MDKESIKANVVELLTNTPCVDAQSVRVRHNSITFNEAEDSMGLSLSVIGRFPDEMCFDVTEGGYRLAFN